MKSWFISSAPTIISLVFEFVANFVIKKLKWSRLIPQIPHFVLTSNSWNSCDDRVNETKAVNEIFRVSLFRALSFIKFYDRAHQRVTSATKILRILFTVCSKRHFPLFGEAVGYDDPLPPPYWIFTRWKNIFMRKANVLTLSQCLWSLRKLRWLRAGVGEDSNESASCCEKILCEEKHFPWIFARESDGKAERFSYEMIFRSIASSLIISRSLLRASSRWSYDDLRQYWMEFSVARTWNSE